MSNKTDLNTFVNVKKYLFTQEYTLFIFSICAPVSPIFRHCYITVQWASAKIVPIKKGNQQFSVRHNLQPYTCSNMVSMELELFAYMNRNGCKTNPYFVPG